MLSEPDYDEVEPRKTREGATLPREVGLLNLHQDVYEENYIDGICQTMSRSYLIFCSLYKVGFLVPHGKTSDDTWVVRITRIFLRIIGISAQYCTSMVSLHTGSRLVHGCIYVLSITRVTRSGAYRNVATM